MQHGDVCPVCGNDNVYVHGQFWQNRDELREVVYCETCDRKYLAKYVFTDWMDEHGFLIKER